MLFNRSRIFVLLTVWLGGIQAAGAVGEPVPGAVTPQTVKLPDGPGSIRGLANDATVASFTGQVSYGIPIELPSGPGGLAPKLALRYSGALGNGAIGLGWTFGQVTVRRSLRLGVPSYSDSDELELSGLSGATLVPMGNGKFRAEGQGNSVRGIAVDGGFELIDATGTRYRVGTSEASRLASDGRIAAWYIERVTDVAGHTIDYSYQRDRGELYLSAITWGDDDAFRADLNYEDRADAVVSWRTGFSITTGRRLRSIALSSYGGLRQTVELTYDPQFALSRLATARVVGRDGTVSPITTLSYAAPSPGEVTVVENTGGWTLGGSVSLFDVDGDGAMDLLSVDGNGTRYRRNMGGSFGEETDIGGIGGVAMSSVRMLDLDGDSGAELVTRVSSMWQAYRIIDGAWVGAEWPGSEGMSLKDVAVADLNGDFRMDAIAATDGGIAVWFGTESGFAPPVLLDPISAVDPGLTPNNVIFPDINGDGLADAVEVRSDGLVVLLGRGDGTFEPVGPVSYPWGESVDPASVRLADLDRDGLIDLVRIDSSLVYWYPGLPDGTFSPIVSALERPPGSDAASVVALADANGNGSTDVVWSSPSGMWVIDLAGPRTAGLLVGIDNGLGKVQRFDYTASTQLAWSAEQSGKPWAQLMPTSIAVTTTATQQLASGDPDRISLLDVRDAIYERGERRFIGFGQSIQTLPGLNADDAMRVVTTYHPGHGDDRVLRGQELSTRTEDGAGNVFKQVDNQVEALAVAGLSGDPRLRRAAVKQTVTTFSAPGEPSAVVRTRYQFDSEGRRFEEDRDGRVVEGVSLDGDETILRWSFTDEDPVSGVRDLPCQEDLYDGAGALVSRTRRRFGDDTSIADLCHSGKGWIREEVGLLVKENRWITLSETRYDHHGNAIEMTAGGVTRTIGYDRHGLHPTSESAFPAPGQILTWTADWDDVAGTLRQGISPNGVITTLTHDGLGRLTSIATNGAPAHVHYRYNWAGPRPSTETFTFQGDAADLGELPETWTPNAGWRHSVTVNNGASEQLLTAVQLDTDQWIVGEHRTRDRRGRVTAIARAFAFTGDLSTAIPPLDTATQTLTYDPLDRVVDQVAPTGSHRRTVYHPLGATATIDGLAAVRTSTDGQLRITRTDRTVNGILESVDASYDAAGRIIELSLQGGQVKHEFEYDSLGRLRHAQDPDVGPRSIDYDDGGRPIHVINGADQAVTYSYDGAGRLLTVDAAGVALRYHYDTARTAGFGHAEGQLAWVEEPTGTVDLGYDGAGRLATRQRTISDAGTTLIGRETTVFSPSGLAREIDLGDGVVLPVRHDVAGRISQIDGVWTAESFDPSDAPLRERFDNGVVQRYERDPASRPTRVTVENAGGALYDVAATYSSFGAIATLADLDGAGLDHTAQFGFDGAARLAAATLGAGAGAYQFSYAYNGLQGLTQRTASGPTALGILAGTYQYRPEAPRQLAQVVAATGDVIARFAYDGAGRQVQHVDRHVTYNALSQVTRVDGPAGAVTEHRYGYDGNRVATRSASGERTYWITPNVVLRGNERDHYVRIGDRVIARITTTTAPASPSAAAAIVQRGRAGIAGFSVLAILGLAALAWRRGRGAAYRSARILRSTLAVSLAMLAATAGCGSWTLSEQTGALAGAGRVYLHAAYAAGPELVTGPSGELHDERRVEPFGAAIDSLRDGAVQPIDYHENPLNALNKFSDADTGWSYHGARWFTPDTAQWLSPDPPTEAPDPKFVAQPWSLHPYQYAGQNPIQYWDPDGRDPKEVCYVIRMPTDADGKAVGPYGFVGDSPSGARFGFGLLNGDIGPDVNANAFHIDGGIGKWQDASRTTNYGFNIDGGLAQVNIAVTHDRPVGLDFGAMHGNIGIYGNDKSATAGAQFNLIDGAATVGSPGDQVRFGFSLGMGGAVRVHYAVQPDGNRALGVGIDAGIAEVDFKTTMFTGIWHAVSGATTLNDGPSLSAMSQAMPIAPAAENPGDSYPWP